MKFPRFTRPVFAALAAVGSLSCSLLQAEAPRFPTDDEMVRLAREAASGPSRALATAPALAVDTSSREAVRQFYLTLCIPGDDAPIGWTGSLVTGDAGTTSAAFKDAVLLRINAMRALAGVPATVMFNDTFSAKAQQAALMESANSPKSGPTQVLSHEPPASWQFYTADAAEAARNSNLAIGRYGTTAITEGYIGDAGSNNAAVGHRRWLLLPQTLMMGTGDLPDTADYWATNATWVLDGHSGDARPATRTAYVAWPAKGYFPAPLIFPRWSFSYPSADFSNATVTMTRDGAAVPVRIDSASAPGTSGAGENTLVWVYDGLDATKLTTPTVTSDSVFHVNVSNVVVGGVAQNFEYDVTAFDPRRAGSDTVATTVSGPAAPAVGQVNTYTVARPAFADAVQWRSLRLDAAIPTYNAEDGLAGLVATTTGSYNPRTIATVGAGTGSYQLATDSFRNQYLTAPETFYAPATGTPQITFLSRLGFATANQVARVQVSTDDGVSWVDLATQSGSGSGSTPTEGSFTAHSVSLASVAGLTFRLRFAYTYGSGTVFTQTDPGVGWFLDNITLTGVQRVAAISALTTSAGTSFAFTPDTTGAAALQARALWFGTYPMAWGPIYPVNAVNAPNGPPATFANIATRAYCSTGNSVTIGGFVISGSGSKRVLVRAVGPSLTAQGIGAGEVLLDPTIEVHHGADIIATNDNLSDNGNAAEIKTVSHTIGAVDLLQSDTTSAALLARLDPGVYSFVVKGKGDSSGIVLLEIYDADATPSGANFVNIAARAYCSTGNNVTIGGFVISGHRAKQVLMRAVGPTLTTQGIKPSEVLVDPSIELHGGPTVETIDNAGEAGDGAPIRATAARIGATPLAEDDTTSSAALRTLQPGVYSFIVRGKSNTSGIVLVEVYDAD